MILAIGLTSATRRGRAPVLDDLTFEARPGRITALLGPAGAGKTTALRLMLQLQGGRGVALFRGRPLHRVQRPAREVGVLLGDVPGHPARSARGHLRMLTAVAGVPLARAEEMLDVVGLGDLADQRLGTFSLGMDRRLGLAAALLGDPHTLVLDEPARGLGPRDTAWLHGLLRGYAEQGGTVLTTTRDPREAARLADRVVTVEDGRLRADQDADDFARTRLRPRVVVTSPHAGRLAAVLSQEARSAAHAGVFAAARTAASGAVRPPSPDATAGVPGGGGPGGTFGPVEVVQESGGRICVYGGSCAMVGEVAYRHGILVHRLTEEAGDTGAPASPPPQRGGGEVPPPAGGSRGAGMRARARVTSPRPQAPPRLPAVRSPGPCRPVRYELRRLAGVRSGWLVMAAALLAGLVAAVLLGHTDGPRAVRALTGWPAVLPLPPAAAAAGLLGALSFGQEFRYPALVPARAPVPRRLGLLVAKLTVGSAVALVLTLCAAILNAAALTLLYGAGFLGLPAHWGLWLSATAALAVGCAWAGVLAAAVLRSTVLGAAAVLAVPLVLAPAARRLPGDAGADVVAVLSRRLEPLLAVRWPGGTDAWAPAAARLLSQPVTGALALTLLGLLGAYACTTAYRRVR
ncbi:ATP-binding cassette domain-containing protein [Streptomyces sp. TRM 70351]|uniref:ATP-binding cassette domain-containing protein n=1 Tax=Streptomyces sp. TRM 70351 TaxID=3116552 RepID=UPI002E7B354B|nr:ATP-binding cassette domain-containing protein [Streptomyces sp. TRM 70351]MEE1926636.1 ATP-binding cassette domain-containing protein [Streptomyces sp. TRM 70351]